MILFLLGCKTVMVKHFDTFSLISHLCCHSCNAHKSSCNLSASSGVRIALYIIQSSAKSLIELCKMDSGRSLI